MKITNRKARFDYQILDTIEAGIQLTGPEVKSIKNRRAKLEGSFVKIINGEVFLINASISPYKFARYESYDPNRSRKLLLRKRQIISLETKMRGSNLTLIPLSCYTKRGVIKIQIGLAKGKKKYEKKQRKKRRDLEREAHREIQNTEFGI